MPTFAKLALCRSALLASAISLAAAGAAAEGITLPPDSSKLRPSTLPGYALAQQKCGICHSADYISHHPPPASAKRSGRPRWARCSTLMARR